MIRYVFLLTLLTYTFDMTAQIVNIEDRRTAPADTTSFLGRIDLGFDIRENGSNIINLLGGVQAEYRLEKQTYLAVVNFNQVIINDDNIVNEGVAHFRYNYDLNEWITWEAFLQGQKNERLALTFRGLAGTGPRLKLIKRGNQRAFLGVAYMYEYDQIRDTSLVFNDHRLSTYLSLQLKPLENITISSTNYFQPKLDPWVEYRVSSKSSIAIHITKRFSFVTSFSISYDTRLGKEIPDVPSTVYAFTNRLRFVF